MTTDYEHLVMPASEIYQQRIIEPIKEAMRAKYPSQVAFARALDIPDSNLSAMLSGARPIPAATLGLMCECLDLQLSAKS